MKDVMKRPADEISPGVEEKGGWGAQFDAQSVEVDWLWQGFLACGEITLLTSQWKTGKTTLISLLLARLKQGGALADLAVRPGKAVIVSEETVSAWKRRHQKFDLGHVYFLCLPFRSKPTSAQWLALIDKLAELHAKHELSLAVIDTLTMFLPGQAEANGSLMMESLAPLRRLTEQGLSLLLSHHPAKGALRSGQAARGTGALPSFTDINLEMSCYHPSDPANRRRRILAHSRHEATPRHLLMELNEAGNDYQVRDTIVDEFGENWEHLRIVLDDTVGKRTRKELLGEWPADFAKPSDSTLSRWLKHAAEAGLICQEGTGRKSEPLHYWLPGKEEEWRKDPMYVFNEMFENDQKILAGLR